MDKKQVLELVRVAGTAALTTGIGLSKVIKGKQHPAVFGLGVATAMTALAATVKQMIDEPGSTEPEPQQ